MYIRQHIATGVIVSAGVGWYVTPEAGVSVMFGSAFLDLDHYLWYASRFRDLSLRRARGFFKENKANDHYCLCVLHTLEAIAIYIAFLWMNGVIFWFSIGCLIHMILDVGQSIRDGGLFLRKWSLIHAILYWANIRFRSREKEKRH